MNRTENAIAAREVLTFDFFGGWEPSDKELFERYAWDEEPSPGMITDFLGIKIRTEFHPWANHFDGARISEVPIPDDSLKAEAIEYFSLFYAIEASSDKFYFAELGASYAPWTCAAGVVAERNGITDVKLVAVEASDHHFDLISKHLADNGIDPNGSSVRLLNGAVSPSAGTLYFPKVSNAGENGGQATTESVDTDYVGRKVEHVPVKGIPLDDILGKDTFDLLHLDIQGSEFEVLQASIDLLNSQVRMLYVGTHSRLIEGKLLDLLHQNGWRLVRERPTQYEYCPQRPNIVGWTTRDGAQFWENQNLKSTE